MVNGWKGVYKGCVKFKYLKISVEDICGCILEKDTFPGEVGKMMMCKKCSMMCGLILLILGVLFLLRDLSVWDFWGISWWTALFILFGLVHMCKHSCHDCNSMCSEMKKKR